MAKALDENRISCWDLDLPKRLRPSWQRHIRNYRDPNTLPDWLAWQYRQLAALHAKAQPLVPRGWYD